MNQEKINLRGCLSGFLGGTVGTVIGVILLGLVLVLITMTPSLLGLTTPINEAEIYQVDLSQQSTTLTLQRGEYTILTPHRTTVYYDIALKQTSSNGPIPLNRIRNSIQYELTEKNLKGTAIYEFNVSESDDYIIEVNELTNEYLTVFRNYSSRNQIVIFSFYGLLILIIGVGIYRYLSRYRSTSKAEAKEKAQKWDDWTNS